jgi:hypothetical protein
MLDVGVCRPPGGVQNLPPLATTGLAKKGCDAFVEEDGRLRGGPEPAGTATFSGRSSRVTWRRDRAACFASGASLSRICSSRWQRRKTGDPRVSPASSARKAGRRPLRKISCEKLHPSSPPQPERIANRSAPPPFAALSTAIASGTGQHEPSRVQQRIDGAKRPTMPSCARLAAGHYRDLSTMPIDQPICLQGVGGVSIGA